MLRIACADAPSEFTYLHYMNLRPTCISSVNTQHDLELRLTPAVTRVAKINENRLETVNARIAHKSKAALVLRHQYAIHVNTRLRHSDGARADVNQPQRAFRKQTDASATPEGRDPMRRISGEGELQSVQLPREPHTP